MTVAWFQSKRSCIGAPTILLLPTTTARFPAIETPEQNRHKAMITHEIKDYIQLDGFRDILLKYMIVPWDQSMVEGEVSGFC